MRKLTNKLHDMLHLLSNLGQSMRQANKTHTEPDMNKAYDDYEDVCKIVDELVLDDKLSERENDET